MTDSNQKTAPPEAAATPPANESAGEPAGFDFEALANYDENAEAPEPGKEAVPAPAAPAEQQVPAAPSAAVPEVPPATAAAPPPVPPPEAQVQPPAPPAQAAPVPAAPAVPELSPEKHREQFLPQLEKMYALNDAEVEELRVNPGVAFPKMAARLHYEVQMAAYQGIVQVLPQMIEGSMKSQVEANQHEKAFYSAWPKLEEKVKQDPEAAKAIVASITSFRQLNPKATTEQIIARAGLLASMTLGIPIEQGAAPPPPAPPAPQVPTRPPGVGATGHIPMQAPNTPAGGAESDIDSLVDAHLRGDI